jgi:hypothetical protein
MLVSILVASSCSPGGRTRKGRFFLENHAAFELGHGSSHWGCIEMLIGALLSIRAVWQCVGVGVDVRITGDHVLSGVCWFIVAGDVTVLPTIFFFIQRGTFSKRLFCWIYVAGFLGLNCGSSYVHTCTWRFLIWTLSFHV